MICLMVCQSHLSTAAIVFYTCIWIPCLRLKRALLRILGIISLAYDEEFGTEPSFLWIFLLNVKPSHAKCTHGLFSNTPSSYFAFSWH
ncbi:hypothetical protein FEM48_Zijuj01G0241800 [Ziziphus jujuba var. spinosa]|uniref:Uncharacterized protein n=1 Tax=Ziziphus jujuba var. spinosa TaxID=714518 RepID=A0A978W4D8_ZIZJJ|nr:hypothetical protein FEM48_Zijuj01G0241800 [Ziziphus jujuba var. spinosa]